MFTLRCTQKLFRRGLTESTGGDEPATTLLGDWYAGILFCRPQHLVLCVSERTLLPVVVPAKDAKHLASRLMESLVPVLAALEIDPAAVATERQAMQSSRVGRTLNKRVLGSLTELMFQFEHSVRAHPERSPFSHSLRLAETPMSMLERSFPDRSTQALFLSNSVVQLAQSRSAL